MFLGDHTTYFFDSIKRKHSLLFSNLLYGMKAGCSALYITSGESVDMVKVELNKFGLRSDDAQKLKIVSSYQWYTPDGNLNPKRIVDQYSCLIDQSIDKGFAGLYVSADASDTLDYFSKKGLVKEWTDYEGSLGTTFNFPMEAICAYRSDQIMSNFHVLLEMLNAHKDTLSLKTEKKMYNNQLIRTAIFHQLKEILGKTLTSLVLEELDNNILEQNLSATNIENFWDLLEKIIGKDSHLFSSLEQNIQKEICTRIMFNSLNSKIFKNDIFGGRLFV